MILNVKMMYICFKLAVKFGIATVTGIKSPVGMSDIPDNSERAVLDFIADIAEYGGVVEISVSFKQDLYRILRFGIGRAF